MRYAMLVILSLFLATVARGSCAGETLEAPVTATVEVPASVLTSVPPMAVEPQAGLSLSSCFDCATFGEDLAISAILVVLLLPFLAALHRGVTRGNQLVLLRLSS